jgi:hypothetical protein
MAIYRTNSNRRLAMACVGALLVGIVIGIVIGRWSAPGLATQLADLRASAAPITTSLEVVRSEYPKLLAAGADPGGASGALARVRTTFDSIRPSLDALSAAGAEAASNDLEALEAGVAAREPEADVGGRIDGFQTSLDDLIGIAGP